MVFLFLVIVFGYCITTIFLRKAAVIDWYGVSELGDITLHLFACRSFVFLNFFELPDRA